ncbi:MAG TPA: hypothetical protein VK903_15340 [Propionicimonas sp.]|nr:hypothetical protein [Propionicimonas sp.]
MAEPVVSLDPPRLSVDPGGQATLVVTVFNPGTVVEGYDVDVVSTTPMPWATASPETLSVYPQQEASTVITFAPPSGPGAPGGSFPFGIRLRSQVDADNATVAEGDLDIGAVSGLQAVLTPVTSSGRWGGRHTLRLSNWGNAPARLRLIAQDPDQALGFMVSPPVLDVPLGGEAMARLKVRTRHPVLRGANQRLPFQVLCEPEEPQTMGTPRTGVSTPERPVVDGAFNQKPILTKMVVTVAGLLLLALIGLILWLVLRDKDEPKDESNAVLSVPTGLDATPSPGVVKLTWDAAQGVDSYEVLQTKPDSQAKEVTALFDPDDPATYLVRLKVETADEYCYQLRALRGDGARSAVSQPEVCVTTSLPKGSQPSPSPAPMATLSPKAGESPVEPSTGPSTSAPPTSPPDGSQDPQPFISVLKFYNGDATTAPQLAVRDLAALQAAGVQAKLLHSDEWTLAPALATPGWLLYVDAATAEELAGDCQAILDQVPDVVRDCALAQPRQVTGPSPAAPTPST